MKTSKEQGNAKPKKTPAGGKSVKAKKVTSIKSGPTDEDIRVKAKEIYYERIARGEHGTAEDDWHEAEKILRNIKK
jgi:hypothetical protein